MNTFKHVVAEDIYLGVLLPGDVAPGTLHALADVLEAEAAGC